MLKNSFLFLFLCSSTLFADLVEFVSDSGYVNWSTGKVYATGYGVTNSKYKKPIALIRSKRAATIDARRNLLESIGGVKIDSQTVIKDGMLKSDTIKSTISGVIKGAIITKMEEEDSMVKVTIEAPLNGSVLDAVYPELVENDLLSVMNRKFPYRHIDMLFASIDDREIYKIYQRLDRLDKAVFYEDKMIKKEVTGVIIDARGTNFIPTLSPKIFQIRKARPMYPDGVVDKDTLISSFSALFVNSLIDAKEHPKVGDYPIVIKALRTYGKWRDKLILGNNSSARFSKLLNKDVLKNANVVIVISK
ncbi:MAG: hypothetical protein U9N59_06800 [Campylobacterota bacterium]|nr:hypothetical protein [Campylobacterota bacterium]